MITFNGKPVTNPIGIVACSIALGFGVALMAIALCLIPFLIIAAAIVHPLFSFAGRRGTIREGGTHITLDKTSFERVK